MKPSTLAACTSSTLANAARYADELADAMPRFSINTSNRVACFLANVAHETRGLAAVEEDLYYTTPDRLRAIFPSLFVAAKGGKYQAEAFARKPAELSRIKYGGYHGRGLMHLTWRENYQAAGDALGVDYVAWPELVTQPKHAALTACWFWAEFKDLNALADRAAMREIRVKVNGPAALGMSETITQRQVALRAIAAEGVA